MAWLLAGALKHGDIGKRHWDDRDMGESDKDRHYSTANGVLGPDDPAKLQHVFASFAQGEGGKG
jgi:hypothetical protein